MKLHVFMNHVLRTLASSCFSLLSLPFLSLPSSALPPASASMLLAMTVSS